MGTLSPSGPLVLRQCHYGSSCPLTAITSLIPVIRRYHYRFQMSSSWVDMPHVLTTYLIGSLNSDMAQLNSTKVCELNEGGQLVGHRFHLIDHFHSSCSFEILFMQLRNRFRHLPAQSLLCYAYFRLGHFISSLLLLLVLCMLGLGLLLMISRSNIAPCMFHTSCCADPVSGICFSKGSAATGIL